MKRRKFLKVAGSGSLLGLAGCTSTTNNSGDRDENVSNNSEDSEDENNEDGSQNNKNGSSNAGINFPDCKEPVLGEKRVRLNTFTVNNSYEKPRSIKVSVYEFGEVSESDFQNRSIKKLIENSSVSCVYGREFDLDSKKSTKIRKGLFTAKNSYLIRATSGGDSAIRKINPSQNCEFKKLSMSVETGSKGEIRITPAHGDYTPKEDPCSSSGNNRSSQREYCVDRDRLSLVGEEDEVKYGSSGDFELTAEPKTVNIGERITFELRNTGDKDKTTGTKDRYTIQKKDDNGWKDIHWTGRHAGWDAIAQIHEPGNGFSWTFPITQHGISKAYEPYMVCSSISPGEYRFVFIMEKEKGIAAKFTVEGCGDKPDESAGDSVIEVEWTKSSPPGEKYIPINFSELSSGEKEILKTVIEQGSYQTCSTSKAFRKFFFERARKVVKEQGENAGVVYLKYDGNYYGLKIRKQDMVIASG